MKPKIALRNQTIILAACLSLMLVGNANSQQSKSIEVDKNTLIFATCTKAQQLIGQGKNYEAKTLLEKAIPYDPNPYSSTVHELLAEADQNVGNIDSSIAEYHKALQFKPDLPSAMWNLALTYKDATRYDDALSWAKRFVAVTNNPQFKQQAVRFIADIEKLKASSSALEQPGRNYVDVLASKGQLHPWLPQQFPLRVYVYPGTAIPGFKPEFKDMLGDSFRRWAQASQNRISYMEVNDPRQANFTVDWTNDPRRVATAGNTVVEQGIALTQYVKCPDGVQRIERASVTFLTINPVTGQESLPSEIQTLCLHEVGHALGLNGHSDNPSDIMFFSCTGKQLPALSKNDKEAIARLYAGYPERGPVQ